MRSAVILVVDDEPLVLRIVSNILSAFGYAVLSAASPDEALDIARRHAAPIRLMIADVLLPRINGPELADLMAQLHPETSSLFIAGLPDSAEVCNEVIKRGRPFLAKPFVARTLLDKIAEVVGHDAVPS